MQEGKLMFDLFNLLLFSLLLNLFLVIRIRLIKLSNRRLRGQLEWLEAHQRGPNSRPGAFGAVFIVAAAFWMLFLVLRLLA